MLINLSAILFIGTSVDWKALIVYKYNSYSLSEVSFLIVRSIDELEKYQVPHSKEKNVTFHLICFTSI